MRRYGFHELQKFGGNLNPQTIYRIARIVAINEINGTVNIMWLDHPGGRDNVQINQAGFGDWEFPVINAVVLIGMRGDQPEILRYVPLSYKNQVQLRDVPQLFPGEKLFMSYRQEADNVAGQTIMPTPTDAYFKMDNQGRIILSSPADNKLTINPSDSSITIETMTQYVETEAGVLTFGVTEREYPSVIPGQSADLRQVFKNSVTGETYTEFRLRVLDSSDTDIATDPDVDDPFIELTLGTKLKRSGVGSTTVWTPDQSSEGKDIAISLTVRKKNALLSAGRETTFNFVVDKEGNVKMTVDGKFVVSCDDIELGGGGSEQPVVLRSFLTTYYNSHTQIGNLGFPGGPPIIPAPVTSPTVSTKTKVE